MWLEWWIKRAKRTITIAGAGDDDTTRQADKRNKGVIFKNCAPLIKCASD